MDYTNVAMIKYQESIISRGLEKKMKDLNCSIININGQTLEGFDRSLEVAAFFVIYLPGDVTDDSIQVREFDSICKKILSTNKQAIIIGEEKHREGLTERVPLAATYTWIDRPVDTEEFTRIIKEAIEDEEIIPAELKKILIVDDDPAYAKMVKEWLKNDYQVSIVTAGMQAITYLSKHEADLVLLDYEMPIVDGPQVLEMFRSEDSLKDIPVVFLTGIGKKESVSRAAALKPMGYVLKSTTRNELLKFLKGLDI
ncbi:MAG: response regulator [Eubacterium sp.]|nr:response regulator [Eubacterium sp.]